MRIRRTLLKGSLGSVCGWTCAFLFALVVADVAARTQVPPDAPVAPRAPVAPADPTQPTGRIPPRQVVLPTEVEQRGQQGGAQAGPQTGADPDNPFIGDFDEERTSRPVLRIGQDYTVAAGTTVREVVVISGTVTIDGRVDRDVVVVLGTLRLGPAAVVNGSLVAVAGAVAIAPGAQVRRDFVVVASGLQAPPDFSPGGEQVVVGTTGLMNGVQTVIPWATRGLMLGRLIVPSLPWMWTVIAIIGFVYLLLNLLFERAVRASADILAAKPISTFFVGLLVLLLTGPVAFILAVSIVGLVVLPFAFCALVIAWVIGKVAVSRAIGASLLVEEEPGNKLQAARSFLIGFAIICVAYMIPVLGLVTFVLVAVFGLGCASMALLAGLRRENPAKPKPPRPVPPPAPVQTLTTPPASVAADHGVTGMASAGVSYVAAPDAAAPGAPPGASSYVGGGAAAAMHPPVAEGTLISMPKAAFLDRAAAFGLDLVLVIFAFAMLDFGVFRHGPQPFLLLLLVYHIAFWTMKATTVGGIICNLRLVRTDGGPIGFSEALIRGLSSIFSIVVVGLGCLWILRDPDSQAWHDRFAGTFVVKVPRHWPL